MTGSETLAGQLRVAVISSGGPADLGHSVAAGFRALGAEAIVMREPAPRLSRLSSLALRCQVTLPSAFVADRLELGRLACLGPSLVVFMKTPFVSPADVRSVARVAPTICWNADSPFDAAISNNGAAIQRALGAYDAYVTWSSSLAAALSDLRDCVYRIPFAWDPQLGEEATDIVQSTDEVVFVGTASAERAAVLRRLAPLRPVVYGNGWGRVGVSARPAVAGTAMTTVLRGARWALNLLRPQNRDSHNMRTFELLGLGANQLSFRTIDHVDFLAGSPHKLVDSVEEMIQVGESQPPASVIRRPPPPTYADRCRDLLTLLKRDGLIA